MIVRKKLMKTRILAFKTNWNKNKIKFSYFFSFHLRQAAADSAKPVSLVSGYT